jgi:aryl-alcohol dehydrogenase-like predicted oxidoreductase/spore coat polysaccharide biosynthesis protein SpsF (cytidylyltransferase family)
MVILAAKRASNNGKKTIVVTSTDESDNLLCAYLKLHEINFFRGSLNNTLERFIQALDGLNDRTIVHRLTADNVFPDGALISELENEFITKNLEYLVCNGAKSGLPYGLSVETFRLSTLREAYKCATLEYDLEHVTPFIAKNKPTYFFEKYKDLNLGSFSCTVDTYSDYLFLNKIFINTSNPETISWKDLIDQMKSVLANQENNLSGEKLVLGGVQFGMNYGINNSIGKPTNDEVEKILKTAIKHGIKHIDTARSYGSSENLIGSYVNHKHRKKISISTKLSSLDGCPDDSDHETVRTYIRESILSSCMNLKCSQIDYLLLHRVEQLYKWGDTLIESLQELKIEGFIDKIGASVQNINELNNMLDNENIMLIQMPFNIIDRRWDGLIDKIKKIKKQRGLIIHVRSVFLQGLLLTQDKEKWQRANVNNPHEIIEWLGKMSLSHGNNSLIELCLSFVRSQNWIDGIVVGVETEMQLLENLKIFSMPLMNQDDILSIITTNPIISNDTLDPSNWSK